MNGVVFLFATRYTISELDWAILRDANVPVTFVKCNPADIADNGSNAATDGCVDNGDFSLFIAQFFSTSVQAACSGSAIPCAAADIADNGSNPTPDGLLDNGDFSLFISAFFGANCPSCAG
jgi:hypothetical protein